MRLLLLLFVIVPLGELYMLLWVSRLIGFWPTVAITLATGIVGGTLAKREGLRVFRQWNEAVSQMRAPETGIVEGVLVLVGGVLLITPGVFTDAIGLAFLIPFTRRPLARFVKSRVKLKTVSMGGATGLGQIPPSPPSQQPPFTVVDTSGESRDD